MVVWKNQKSTARVEEEKNTASILKGKERIGPKQGSMLKAASRHGGSQKSKGREDAGGRHSSFRKLIKGTAASIDEQEVVRFSKRGKRKRTAEGPGKHERDVGNLFQTREGLECDTKKSRIDTKCPLPIGGKSF